MLCPQKDTKGCLLNLLLLALEIRLMDWTIRNVLVYGTMTMVMAQLGWQPNLLIGNSNLEVLKFNLDYYRELFIFCRNKCCKIVCVFFKFNLELDFEI